MQRMKHREYLNAYHREYSMRMKRSVTRRSKQPPMSPEAFIKQVSRLG